MFSQPSYSALPSGGSAFFASSQSLSGLSFSDAPPISLSQQFAPSVSASQVEASSPEAFKQNIQLAMTQVARVQALARSILLSTEHAYQPSNHPIQTEADIAELQQALHLLAELLRHSGVGALPLSPPPPDVPSLPSEDEERKIAEVTAAVQALFEKRKRLEESAGMVVSLLAAEKDGRR